VFSGLRECVQSEVGPDATSLGWIYQHTLVDTSHQHSLADVRLYQDWYLRFTTWLMGIP
jgi:Cu(I)/Ag(I) efflux system membrane protein CusA/SilA